MTDARIAFSFKVTEWLAIAVIKAVVTNSGFTAKLDYDGEWMVAAYDGVTWRPFSGPQVKVAVAALKAARVFVRGAEVKP